MHEIDMLLYFVTSDDDKNKCDNVINNDEKVKIALAKFKAVKEREKQLLM